MSRFYDLESIQHDDDGNVIRRPLEILVRQDEHHILGKRLGRHLEHDPLSKMFAVQGVSDILDSANIESVAWERNCDVYDQGDIGSCTGMAMAGLLMTGRFAEMGLRLGENEALDLYSDATKLDRIPGEYPENDTGSSGLAVAKAAKLIGLIDAYHHAFSMRAALKALQTGPVISGFHWYDSFDFPDANGTVHVLPGAQARGGHEVCVSQLKLEYRGDGTIDEEHTLIGMWNSWGKSFGREGAFNMSLRTWRYLMKEYGDITVPVKNAPEPESSEV